MFHAKRYGGRGNFYYSGVGDQVYAVAGEFILSPMLKISILKEFDGDTSAYLDMASEYCNFRQ